MKELLKQFVLGGRRKHIVNTLYITFKITVREN